jgi:hypothetical protein
VVLGMTAFSRMRAGRAPSKPSLNSKRFCREYNMHRFY